MSYYRCSVRHYKRAFPISDRLVRVTLYSSCQEAIPLIIIQSECWRHFLQDWGGRRPPVPVHSQATSNINKNRKKFKFETESKPAFWIVRRNCLKGFCHEMNIFLRVIILNIGTFLFMRCWFFTIFCVLVDEIIKLKVLAIELLKLLTNFENAFSNPL